MGVAGLWDVLKPAAQVRSLTDIAIKDGFEANPDGKRGFRIGIDASIWFFHAEYGREGENPVLRTLFFRCATLMHTTFLPIFVFDGPKRPEVKRGKKINRTPHKLIPGMKQIVEAFGFEWRTAPGEAEAELAYLNRIGVIDAVLSDDVDNFLFGATMVIRNTSNTLSGNRANPALNSAGKDDGNHARVFRIEDISNHPEVQLTRGGMILIGLMSGGDYEQGGLARFGVSTAHGLAKCGFGDTLYEAARTMERDELAEFLVSWRQGLRHELRTDSQEILGRKHVALSKAIPEDFPDIDILLSYVDPITSESMGRESNNTKLTWSKEPNVSKLAETCELHFEWGYKEAIVKRFRTVIWHSIVLRILRRAVLNVDARAARSQHQILQTPRKKKPREGVVPCGTPSKMIARHFASLGLNSPQKQGSDESSGEEDEKERLIINIHSSRTHVSTDGLLEYRLEIAPAQLVRLAEAGVRGLRDSEGPDEWASEKEDDDDIPKKGKGKQVDPQSHLRVWMPACMVRLAEPALVQQYEEKEEEKRRRREKKGTRRVAAVNDTEATTKEKRPRKNTKKTAAAPVLPPPPISELDDDLFVSPPLQRTRVTSPVAECPRVISISLSDDDGDSSDSSLPSPCRLFAPNVGTQVHDSPLVGTLKTTGLNTRNAFLSSPVSTRIGIKDLTKKKKPANPVTDIKSLCAIIQKPATPPKTNAGKTPASLTATELLIVPDSEPARAKLRTSLQNKGIPIDFGVPPLASTSSLPQKASPPSLTRFNVPVLRNIKPPETDTLSLSDDNDYDPIIWNKNPPSNKIGLSSPSKRKSYTPASSHSESEHTGRQHKSPRKYTSHTASKDTRRPQSPSPIPSTSTSRLSIKPACNVIEISDSDSDISTPTTNLRKLPPLLAARARAQARAASKTSSTSSTSTLAVSSRLSSSKGKHLVTYSDDIIDLT